MSTTEELDLVTLEVKREESLSQARGFKVTDVTTYEQGAGLLRVIKAGREFCAKPIEAAISAAHKAHKNACALREAFLKPFDNADAYVRGQMVTWKTEEQRKADEAARQERDRLQREAEEQRKRDEAAKAEEATALAAQAAEEVDPVLADMLAYQAEEAKVEASQIAAAPLALPVTVAAAPVAPQVAGITDTVLWTFRVTDVRALLQAILDGKCPIGYVQPDLVAIGKEVRREKERFACPGIATKRDAGIRVGGV